MTNNYDKIAKHYDFLSRLVFSRSQVNAQIDQLGNISENDSILIVGGGTGWILDEIANVHPSGLQIIYVEISAKMIALSMKRNYGQNEVVFVNAGIEEFQADQTFDVISTPFLFDNFSQERADRVFQKLDGFLKDKGLWFMVDFTTDDNNWAWWKKILLKLMYAFFKVLGNVEAKKLVNMELYFDKAGYFLVNEAFYYARFIRATVYKK